MSINSLKREKNPRKFAYFYERTYKSRDVEHMIYAPVSDFVASHIIEKLCLDKKDGKLLDIGCGQGSILKHIADRTTVRCFGFDISKTAILKSLDYSDNLHLLVANGEKMPFENNSFDFVIANHILEHVPGDKSMIHEIASITKKEGRIYLSSPNDEQLLHPLLRRHRHFVDNRDGHLRSYSIKKISELLANESIHIIEFGCGGHILMVHVYRWLSLLLSIPYRFINLLTDRKNAFLVRYKSYRIIMDFLLRFVYMIEQRLFKNRQDWHDFFLIAEKV